MCLERDRGYTDEKIDQIFASQMPVESLSAGMCPGDRQQWKYGETQAQVRQILG